MELDKIYCCDALEGLRSLEDCSVDLIITSPPYNKAGLVGKKKRRSYDIWEKNIDYSSDVDNMPEYVYEQWQINILDECARVLKDDGSMFYNHKVRVHRNNIIHPIQWIALSDFRCRQIITWDRGGSPNLDNCRYIPTTELVFWLNKNEHNPRFKNTARLSEVWRIAPQKNTKHPAPFPVEIPDNIIPFVAQGEAITVLDPFIGSGTTAVSAIKNGCHYIGFDVSPDYVAMAEARIIECCNAHS